MLPDRVSNPGPLTYESGALPIALRGPAPIFKVSLKMCTDACKIILFSGQPVQLRDKEKYFTVQVRKVNFPFFVEDIIR